MRFISGHPVVARLIAVWLAVTLQILATISPALAQGRWSVQLDAGVDDLHGRALNEWRTRVEASTGGLFRLDVVAGGGPPGTVLERARSGTVAALIPLSVLAESARELALFDSLFAFPDLGAVDRYQRSVEGEKLLATLRPQGLVGLAFWHHGMVQLAGARPLAGIAGLAGSRIAVAAQPAWVAEQFEALGARAVRGAPAERLQALRAGRVDLAEFTWAEMARAASTLGSLQTVASQHRYSGSVLVVNRQAYDALPDALRQRLRYEAVGVARSLNASVLTREREQQAAAEQASKTPPRRFLSADYEWLYGRLRGSGTGWTKALPGDAARLLVPALAVGNVELARRIYRQASVPALAPELSAPPPMPSPAPPPPPPPPPPAPPPPPPPPSPSPPKAPPPPPHLTPVPPPLPPASAPAPLPAPVPVPAPGPASPLQIDADADASWNSWVQRGNRVETFLEPDFQYEVKLDLSRYRYFENRGAAVTIEVQRLIQEALLPQNRNRPLRLRVRPLLLGAGVERAAEAQDEYLLDLNLDRLQRPGKELAAGEAATLQKLREGRLSLAAAVQSLSAGSISLPVIARQRDAADRTCSHVVFTIWDESGLRPLDHLTQALSVRRPGQGAPECEIAPVQGGFKSITGLLTATRGVEADAALWLIEVPLPDAPRTAALYVDSRRYKAAQVWRAAQRPLPPEVRRDPDDPGVYSWDLMRSLPKLVGDERSLLAQVVEARPTGSYAAVARSLAEALFPPPPKNTANPSLSPQVRALLSLMQLAGPKVDRPPVVLVRATTAQHEPYYLPLGLLAASESAILSRRPTIVQPLKRERYAQACVDRWQLGIPSVIEPGTNNITLDRMPPRATRMTTLAQLSDFLSPPALSAVELARRAAAGAAGASAASAPGPTALPGRGEGLVVLAHQQAGKVWFTGGGRSASIQTENDLHQFPVSSVAVLATCSAASPIDDNLTVMKRLNEMGIDAVVASPFPVEVPWGIELARQFTYAASNAYRRPTAAAGSKRPPMPTVSELLEQAIETSAAVLAQRSDLAAPVRASDKALEFMVIGNHELRLCEQ